MNMFKIYRTEEKHMFHPSFNSKELLNINLFHQQVKNLNCKFTWSDQLESPKKLEPSLINPQQRFVKDLSAKILMKISDRFDAHHKLGKNGDFTFKLIYKKDERVNPFFCTKTNFRNYSMEAILGTKFWYRGLEGDFRLNAEDKGVNVNLKLMNLFDRNGQVENIKELESNIITRNYLENTISVNNKDWLFGGFFELSGIFCKTNFGYNTDLFIKSFGSFYREKDIVVSLEYQNEVKADGKSIVGSIFKKGYKNMFVGMSSKYNISTTENKVKIGASYKLNNDTIFKSIINQNLLLRNELSVKFTDKFKIDTSINVPLNPQANESNTNPQKYPVRMSISYLVD